MTAPDAFESMDAAPRDVHFSAAVAAFGQFLHDDATLTTTAQDDVVALAQGARGDDLFNCRNEFIRLVHLAQSIASAQR